MAPSNTSITTYDSGPSIPVRPQGYAPVTNSNDNPPCNTLFIGNLGAGVSETELRGIFGSQPGFKQMKVRPGVCSPAVPRVVTGARSPLAHQPAVCKASES